MQVAQIFGSDAEVEVQPNGVIEIKHENWLDPPEYYYNKATGLFFRRTLTLDEIIEYGISEVNTGRRFDSACIRWGNTER